MISWLNGVMAAEADLSIPPSDRGFLLAEGVFETLLTIDGRLIAFDAHMARLKQGAAYFGIETPWGATDFRNAADELMEANGLRKGRGVIRITVTGGIGPRGLAPPEHPAPLCLITASRAAPPPKSVRLVMVSIKRFSAAASGRIKSLNYTDNILAKREALTRNADDGVMLNEHGRLACATAANIFHLNNGVLVTPPISEGALPGVTRGQLLERGPAWGVKVKEALLTPEQIASGVLFLTNSLVGLTPVYEVDGVRRSAPSPVFEDLRQAFEGEIWIS